MVFVEEILERHNIVAHIVCGIDTISNGNISNTKLTYPESIKLEAGKAYPFKAYFLETGGGEVMQLNCSVDGGSKYDVSHLFSYYTECPHANVDVTGAKDATETEPGYTGDKVCKDCGETVEKGKEIPATGPATPDTNEPSTEVPPTGDLMIPMIAVAMVGAVAVFAFKKKRAFE